MIILSKLFTLLVLPPGCIIVALVLVTIFVPRKFKIVMSLITALMYLLSIQPVSDLLLRPLENAFPPLHRSTAAIQPEAIVVLGGVTIQGSPEDRAGQDTLGPDAMKRAVYAFNLRDTFDVPYIFSGGKLFNRDQEPEAVTAGRLFIVMGLDPERLLLEPKSRNTWENARETAGFGYKRIILVTSAYHMRRSVFCFERNGMTVIPAPTDYKSDRGRSHDPFGFLPSIRYLNESCLALHEYIGLLCYRLIYTGIQSFYFKA